MAIGLRVSFHHPLSAVALRVFPPYDMGFIFPHHLHQPNNSAHMFRLTSDDGPRYDRERSASPRRDDGPDDSRRRSASPNGNGTDR
jgi:hypothetical protein